MTSWCYEVQTRVDTCIRYGLLTSNAHFFIEVLLKLVIHVVQNRLPAMHTTETYSYY